MRQRLVHAGRLLAVLALLLGSAPAALAATDQGTPGSGVAWVRLGHLSPNAPAVDIYFAPFGQAQRMVVHNAGYGAVTPYSSVPPGQYSLSMRPAGAGPTTPPALSATVAFTEGNAYSLLIFATGPNATLQGNLVNDDMSNPQSGNGRIRIVQGSTSPAPVSVSLTGGPALGTDLGYGLATPYVDVRAGHWPLRLAAGGAGSESPIDLNPGSVTTILVTQQANGLRATPIVDGVGPATMPLMGVQTGAGGAADRSPAWPGWVAGIAAAALGVALLLRRRPIDVR